MKCRIWSKDIFSVALRDYKLSFIVLLVLFVSAGFACLPVVRFDTDLWYHLNSGRYILDNLSLPRDSFFSFVVPPRPWVDYFWLFQVIAYKIYSFSYYYGLVTLRTMAYTGILSLMVFAIYKRKREGDSAIYFAVLLILYFFLLQGRFLNVRPHIFSYSFMVAFIYVLEFGKGRTIFVLPLLAILWANIHGIMYPVMLLMTLSYVMESVVLHLRNRAPLRKEEIFLYSSAALVVCAIVATPHGLRLLSIPFVTTVFASEYIMELKTLVPTSLFSFSVMGGVPFATTAFNVLCLLFLIAVLSALTTKKLRMSHMLLCTGGIGLLLKGGRFTYEFAILVFPFLIANGPGVWLPDKDAWRRVSRGLGLCLLVIAPFLALWQGLVNAPKYPFSPRNLPVGVAKFLNETCLGGNVLNYPDNGGYLQWMLYPKYKILMDMEVPYLFTDQDFFIAANAYSNEEVLRKIIHRYDPSFITVPIGSASFKKVIKHFGEYKPVFFDDAEVLYMNKVHHAFVTSDYELTAIDPFEIVGKSISVIVGETDRATVKTELLRILRVHPEGLLTNQIMAEIYLEEEDYSRARDHASVITAVFPELPWGYKLKGQALAGLNLQEEAIQNYKLAVKRASETEKPDLYKRLCTLYIERGQFANAYDAAKKGVTAFAPETNYVEIYQLGSAALLSGRAKEAEIVLKMGYEKVPDSNVEWKENYRKLFAVLSDRKKKH